MTVHYLHVVYAGTVSHWCVLQRFSLLRKTDTKYKIPTNLPCPFFCRVPAFLPMTSGHLQYQQQEIFLQEVSSWHIRRKFKNISTGNELAKIKVVGRTRLRNSEYYRVDSLNCLFLNIGSIIAADFRFDGQILMVLLNHYRNKNLTFNPRTAGWVQICTPSHPMFFEYFCDRCE